MRPRRIVMPEKAKASDVVEIRAAILHPMVTGHGSGGPNSVPRDIVHTLIVTYDGAEIFRAEMFPGIAANPQLTFTTVATKTGDVVFRWVEDSGAFTTETRRLTVEG
jgi:sulfur-oxidizing protein SoxZ